MKKIVIIYFSRTGNTEKMAQLIRGELAKSSDVQVDVQTQIAPEELAQYDAILIGAPTYHHRMTPTISTLLEDAAIKEVKLEGYVGALELTVIALGTLLLISLCFIGLTRGIQWVASLGKKVEEEDSG